MAVLRQPQDTVTREPERGPGPFLSAHCPQCPLENRQRPRCVLSSPTHTPPPPGMACRFSSCSGTHGPGLPTRAPPTTRPAPPTKVMEGPAPKAASSHPGVTAPPPAAFSVNCTTNTTPGLGAGCETIPQVSQQGPKASFRVLAMRKQRGHQFPRKAHHEVTCPLHVTEMDTCPESRGVEEGSTADHRLFAHNLQTLRFVPSIQTERRRAPSSQTVGVWV